MQARELGAPRYAPITQEPTLTPGRYPSAHPLSPSLLLSACAGTQEPLRPGAERPQTVADSINLSGFPPEFRRGFTDGCAAARRERRVGPTEGDAPYVVGWSDGFDYCRPKKPN